MSPELELVAQTCCWVIVLAPAVAFGLLGTVVLLGLPADERLSNLVTQTAVSTGALSSLVMLAMMAGSGQTSIAIELGHWVALPEHGFHFDFKFVFDKLSVPFLILSQVLCGVVSAFARVYLHREPGYARFYVLFAMFLLGMTVSSIAGTIETLFAGWELVGLSSALLVGFFRERPGPVASGQRVWTMYRIADAAFVLGAVALHKLASGDFALMSGAGAWPHGVVPLSVEEATLVGSLLLVAAAGKSALLPFSGWLPRAMEGPTPSSAIFYGALSVHLGAFLLLRISPVLDRAPALCAAVVLVGAVTACYAWVAARVQPDIKTALAYASLTQLGLIVVEIGLGFRYLPLAHMIGNASLRTLQLLRAPSLLHDHHQLERVITHGRSGRPAAAGAPGPAAAETPGPAAGAPGPVSSWRLWLYRLGFEREGVDMLVFRWLLAPAAVVLHACDRLEQRWIGLLSRGKTIDPDRPPADGSPGDW